MKPTIFDYLPAADANAIYKLAEDESETKHKVKSVLKMMAGTGLGMATGYGLGKATGALYHHATGKKVPKSPLISAVPAIAAGLGTLYSMARSQHEKELTSARKNSHDGSERSLSSG